MIRFIVSGNIPLVKISRPFCAKKNGPRAVPFAVLHFTGISSVPKRM